MTGEQHDGRQPLFDHGRQLGSCHLKGTIAHNRERPPRGLGNSRSQRARPGEAHRGVITGGQKDLGAQLQRDKPAIPTSAVKLYREGSRRLSAAKMSAT
jgi:hypothetical protein